MSGTLTALVLLMFWVGGCQSVTDPLPGGDSELPGGDMMPRGGDTTQHGGHVVRQQLAVVCLGDSNTSPRTDEYGMEWGWCEQLDRLLRIYHDGWHVRANLGVSGAPAYNYSDTWRWQGFGHEPECRVHVDSAWSKVPQPHGAGTISPPRLRGAKLLF